MDVIVVMSVGNNPVHKCLTGILLLLPAVRKC